MGFFPLTDCCLFIIGKLWFMVLDIVVDFFVIQRMQTFNKICCNFAICVSRGKCYCFSSYRLIGIGGSVIIVCSSEYHNSIPLPFCRDRHKAREFLGILRKSTRSKGYPTEPRLPLCGFLYPYVSLALVVLPSAFDICYEF